MRNPAMMAVTRPPSRATANGSCHQPYITSTDDMAMAPMLPCAKLMTFDDRYTSRSPMASNA